MASNKGFSNFITDIMKGKGFKEKKFQQKQEAVAEKISKKGDAAIMDLLDNEDE